VKFYFGGAPSISQLGLVTDFIAKQRGPRAARALLARDLGLRLQVAKTVSTTDRL